MSLQVFSHGNLEPERINGFEDCFSGYHRICLEEPYNLDYVSENLCEMLGYSQAELQMRFGGDYSLLVCKDDRDKFLQFLRNLAEGEKSLTVQYSLRRKDDTVFPVCDCSTSRRMKDGKMVAYSVVSDISYLPEFQPFGELISALLPYGYLQCTCEKYPRVTYINQALREYLYIGQKNDAWEDDAKDNVYFMVPFEERDKFRAYLEAAEDASHHIQIDHHLFRGDGTLAHMTGWISLVPGATGEKEFALLYREVQDIVPYVEPVQDTTYFPVLKRSYSAIFVLNMETGMAECIHGLDDSPIGPLSGIRMSLDSAMRVFVNNYIFSEDKSMMSAFLSQISDPDDDWDGRSVLQAEFRLKSSGNLMKLLGVAVHLDAEQVLLCCRNITDTPYASAQALENKTLHTIYDWMDFLSTHDEDTIGMLMLDETIEDGCSLLYGSSSVLHYLGLDAEDTPHRSTPPSLAECLAAADMTQADFDKMAGGEHIYLWSRSAPEAYLFQLTCKVYKNGDRTLYIIRCRKNYLPQEPEADAKRVFARTFGHFDLFLDNTPITFSSAKEKELMALLIDRNGGTLSPTEAISYLWEDESADERTSARYRKLAMGLKRTLEKYGIEDIVINHNGVRSIDRNAIRCDYYELLAGNPKYRQAFHNVYMTDYSWGEETLATLWNYSES